jgi:hypothetical protein
MAQVAARDLQQNQVIDGQRVAFVDSTTYPGVVYVWFTGSNLNRKADRLFNHGDSVRLED